jgi:hypothetical protein
MLRFRSLSAALAMAATMLVGCGLLGGNDGAEGSGGARGSGGSGGPNCVTGDRSCACYPNNTCNGGLACVGGRCEAATQGSGGAPVGSGGAFGSGGSTIAGTGGQTAVSCSNTNPATLPIDASGWVARQCNNRNIQGGWYCYADGVNATSCAMAQAPYRAGSGMCLSGDTTLDTTFAAWGAGIGLVLNQAGPGGAKTPYNATASGVIGFRVGISGTTGGNPLRIQFTARESGGTAPFVQVTGPATVDVLLADAQVPPTWAVPEAGMRVNPASIYDLQVQVVGAERAAHYDYCVTSVTPIVSATTGTGGSSPGTGGATGSGGRTGSGGATGTGGRTGCGVYSVSGAVSFTGVTDVAFNSAVATVYHKQDVDEFEDGCLSGLMFTFRYGSGCEMVLTAGQCLDAQGRLRVETIEFSADSQCPNFPDAVEGSYFHNTSQPSPGGVRMSTPKVPDRNAAASCVTNRFEIGLMGSLQSLRAGQSPLQIGSSTLVVQGAFNTSGSTAGSCPAMCM